MAKDARFESRALSQLSYSKRSSTATTTAATTTTPGILTRDASSSILCSQNSSMSVPLYSDRYNDYDERIETAMRDAENIRRKCRRRTNNIHATYSHKAPATTVQLLGSALCLCALAASLLQLTPVALAVDCFKCSSRNGSNTACEDPFHNLNTTRITAMYLPDPAPSVVYHAPCYAGKKGRQGLFPASACIKMTGKFETTGETLVVRHCALDSGTLTQDTEISRISHCGKFRFEGDYLEGCVLACSDDACNAAPPRRSVTAFALSAAAATLLTLELAVAPTILA